uniref:Protein NATD1 n=1 Tax=Heterorhabditis bacteriophora TaxID=37862 RepID=A0A1I7XPV8_HETBA
MSFQVQHSKKAMEFFIKFNTGTKAYLQYEQLPNGVLDFHHTVTPKDQQGKGIAKTLVEEGFRYAAENNLRIKPTCSYVAKFVNDCATEEQKKLTTTYNPSFCPNNIKK